MDQVVESTTSDASPSTAFLVELERTWALLRLYGEAHPAFRQRAELAAAATGPQPMRIGVSPRGFLADTATISNDELQPLAKRLTTMGVVGIVVATGLTADHVIAVVRALQDAERSRGNVQMVIARIATATDGKLKVLPVRMDDLRYLTGAAGPANEDDSTATWRELFIRACGGGSVPAEAAKWFESAVRGVRSAGQWTSMLDVWVRELSAIEPAQPSPEGEAAPVDQAGRIDGVALFLQALSPQLRKRLLADTLGHRRAPERVVLALAERLPTAIVLGAFAMLDQTTGEPSPAALALLRKLHLHLTGSALPEDPPPRSNAELAETSSSLEKLLESQEERKFVPDEYLRRREELSRQSVDREAGDAVACPTDEQTNEHAANVALQIMAAADVRPEHLLSGLEFVKERIPQWVRAGQFGLAGQAVCLAGALRSRAEKALVEAASEVVSAAYDLEALRHGLSRASDAGSTEGIAQLLRHADGETLARLLETPMGEGRQRLINAVAELLAQGSEQSLSGLFQAVHDRPPQLVLTVLRTMPVEQALKAVENILPHASAMCRRMVAQTIFERNFPWPVELTRRLLEDREPAVRRLAMMRLMRDADLGTVAGFLHAASRSGPFPVDVALGLSELLRPHRYHKDVRAAYKRWMWSARRWGTFLFMRIGGEKKAAA